MVEKTGQGPDLPPPQQSATLPSAPKTTAADPSLQASRKRFSSLLEKSGSKGEKAAGKLQHHVKKGLDSARKRLDQEPLTGQPHDASRRAGDERKGAQRDTARDVTDLSPAGMHTAHTPVSTEATASPAVQETAPAVHDISRVAQQIADRILVSPPGSTTNPEVRIQLKSSFLDGSEVRVFREGGELKVVFMANTKDAENLVMQNKNQLEQVLGDRLKDERVQVSVELRGSRGTEGEHNEGRSRQQYVAPDDAAEDE